jgi:phage gpG-like protein
MSLLLPITIVVDPALVTASRLNELMAMLEDLEPILKTIGETLETEIAQNFASRGFGTWAALSPLTRENRTRSGYGGEPDLVRSGDLRAALTEQDAPGHKFLVSANEVRVGVYGAVIPYAYWLQHGTARMPARLLVQVRPETIDRIVQIIMDWLGGAAGIRVMAGGALPVG